MKNLFKIAATFLLLFIASQSFAQVAYDVTWWYQGVQYRGLLVPQDDDSWFYRVRYVANGRVQMIDQSMAPVTYSDGIGLHGCCAVYANTQIRCSTYSPDNLVLRYDGTAYNYDDNGSSYVQSITPVSTNREYNRLWTTIFRR